MKTWLSFFLSLSIIIGLFLGCSSSSLPYDKPDKQGNSKDQVLPSSQLISTLYDKSKIGPELVKRNNDFAFHIFKQLNKEDREKNIFISPLSISTALAMTYQGAQGTTKEAMAKALRYSDIDIQVLNESYKNLLPHLMKLDHKIELNIANSIWIRDGVPIQEPFLSINKEVFNALVSTLDFSKEDAANKINQWISDATNEKISQMIEPPIAPDTIMYLINAVYFKGNWADEFNKEHTLNSLFYREDGRSEEVMMMSRNGSVEYGQKDDFKVVRLPYENGKTAMYCILPEEGKSTNEFIEDLDSEKWKIVKDSISHTDDLILQIPRFQLEYGIKSLKGSLINLGMEDAFSDDADFSGIGDNLCINEVFHKAVIDVNEEGSEAAAATVVEMRVTSAVEPIEFIANRPFIFIIADDETDSILFMGKVYNI